MTSLLRTGVPLAHQGFCGKRYMWLSSPISIGHDRLIPVKLLVAARIPTSARKCFMESTRDAAVVFRNSPTSAGSIYPGYTRPLGGLFFRICNF